MSKRLYVEKLQYHHGRIHPTQFTDNIDNIKYNCRVIGKDVMKTSVSELLETPDITVSFPVGKYVCMLLMYLNQNVFKMIFIDFMDNDEVFYEMLQQLSGEDSEIRSAIILTYNKVKLHSKEEKEEFVIVEGVRSVEEL